MQSGKNTYTTIVLTTLFSVNLSRSNFAIVISFNFIISYRTKLEKSFIKCNNLIKFAPMETAEKIRVLSSLIDASQRIVISTHTHPDGDALGSSAALYHYLRSVRGKECVSVVR